MTLITIIVSVVRYAAENPSNAAEEWVAKERSQDRQDHVVAWLLRGLLDDHCCCRLSHRLNHRLKKGKKCFLQGSHSQHEQQQQQQQRQE